MLEESTSRLVLIGVSEPYLRALASWARSQSLEVVVFTGETTEPIHGAALCVIEAVGDDSELVDARLPALRKQLDQPPFVVLARGMGLPTAVRLMKAGVRDVIELPQPVTDAVARATAPISERPASAGVPLVGGSPAIRRLRAEIDAAAATSSTVLITGETGTGKTLAARFIHDVSDRHDEPLVEVNCGALATSVIESELFGHERGAFTGATQARAGRFEAAASGTIILDEIGELGPQLQVKLLRVLEDRIFERVGGTRARKMMARVIAATNRELDVEVRAGRFRADLYYRLNVIQLRVPTLSVRPEDLPSLVHAGFERLSQQLRVTPPTLTDSFYGRLAEHDWPGNVRELMNVLERLLLRHHGGELDAVELDEALGPPGATSPFGSIGTEISEDRRTAGSTDEFETYRAALTRTGGNNHAVARLLGVTVQTVRSALNRHPDLAELRQQLRSIPSRSTKP